MSEQTAAMAAADMLHRHPTPWRLVDRTNVIVDANGGHVVTLNATTGDLEVLAGTLIACANYPIRYIAGMDDA